MRDYDRKAFGAAYAIMAKRFNKNPVETVDSDFHDLDGFTIDEVIPALDEARRTSDHFPRIKALIACAYKQRVWFQGQLQPHRATDDLPRCPTCGAAPAWHRFVVLVGKDRKQEHETERMVIRHGTGKPCERFNGGREFV